VGTVDGVLDTGLPEVARRPAEYCARRGWRAITGN
jgi:hypothetical protein